MDRDLDKNKNLQKKVKPGEQGTTEVKKYGVDGKNTIVDKKVTEPTVNKVDETVVDELGVVSANTKITGDVITKGNLAVYGKIEGNVKANGNVSISGEVSGDIECLNLKLSNCSIVANSKVKNDVIIEENSKIKGKLVCGKISVDGAVHGDIEATESIDIYKNATVIGNIKTKSLAVEAGAQLQGNISMDK